MGDTPVYANPAFRAVPRDAEFSGTQQIVTLGIPYAAASFVITQEASAA